MLFGCTKELLKEEIISCNSSKIYDDQKGSEKLPVRCPAGIDQCIDA
jgi:hypothetical protein